MSRWSRCRLEGARGHLAGGPREERLTALGRPSLQLEQARGALRSSQLIRSQQSSYKSHPDGRDDSMKQVGGWKAAKTPTMPIHSMNFVMALCSKPRRASLLKEGEHKVELAGESKFSLDSSILFLFRAAFGWIFQLHAKQHETCEVNGKIVHFLSS